MCVDDVKIELPPIQNQQEELLAAKEGNNLFVARRIFDKIRREFRRLDIHDLTTMKLYVDKQAFGRHRKTDFVAYAAYHGVTISIPHEKQFISIEQTKELIPIIKDMARAND